MSTEPFINFFTESIKFTIRDKTKIRNWLLKCTSTKKKKIGELNYIFCSDNYLRKINKQYLNHDYFTDIITFPASSKTENLVSGDIFISIDRVKENAKTYSVTQIDELHRVMAHGLLHLCGYRDKSEKEVKKIRKMENEWLRKR